MREKKFTRTYKAPIVVYKQNGQMVEKKLPGYNIAEVEVMVRKLNMEVIEIKEELETLYITEEEFLSLAKPLPKKEKKN